MTDAEKAEYEDVVRQLMLKCEQLAAENARLRSSENSAHNVLKEIYNDPAASPNVRVLAARAAIGHESAPLKPQPAPLDLVAEKTLPLAEVVRKQRRRADALVGEPIDSPKVRSWVWREDFTAPAEDHLLPSPGQGNGDDSGSGNG
jgi:hypothetical protein